MEKLIKLIILYVLIILIKIYLPAFISRKKHTKKDNNVSINQYPYKKKTLLTQTEYEFYKILKEECNKYNILICPKVRMEDFIEVTTQKEHLKYRGYIKSRHIDFIICNQNMEILCGIELDDASHNTTKAQNVDSLKNNIFKEIQIPLYRIIVKKGNYKEQLEKIFPLQTDK